MFGNTFVNGGGGSVFQYLPFHGESVQIPAFTPYYSFPGRVNLTPTFGGGFFPGTVTIKNMVLRTNSAQPATGAMVMQIYTNSGATPLIITVPAGSPAVVASNLIDVVVIPVGNYVQIRFTNLASSPSCQINSFGIEFKM